MPVPQFTLMARSCHCPVCAPQTPPGEQVNVVGHWSKSGWGCVYCGGPVSRLSPLWRVPLTSARSWLGWVGWEVKLWWWGIPRG